MRFAPALAVVAAVVLAPLLVFPASVSASVGPVPPAVRAYVTGGGLVDQLAEQHAAELEGAATPGAISRVFRWTDARLAGDLNGKPVWMANEWVTPLAVAEQPVGVAILALNLDTGQPELVELVTDAAAAAALTAVPDDAELVRDLGSGAWFALVGDTATPLVAGDSGVTAPTPVDALELVPEGPPEGSADEPLLGAADAGPGWGAGLAAASVLLTLAITLLVIRRAETVIL